MSFKVGDRIYCKYHKKFGVIINIDDKSKFNKYPIGAIFKFEIKSKFNGIKSEFYESYTLDGKCWRDNNSVLTHAIDKKINKILSI